jgi:hypothetical protein
MLIQSSNNRVGELIILKVEPPGFTIFVNYQLSTVN